MKKFQLFLSIYLLNLVHTTLIRLQLARPFLPTDWIYTASGSCPVGCRISEMFTEILTFTIVVMMIVFMVEMLLVKVGLKQLYQAGVSAIIYIYCYHWISHLEEDYCEITQMYDTYWFLYGASFLVAYGLFYRFGKREN